ncbi:hypothetical protein KSP39_PZI003762 [Platanthera zijinensis]|uniref:Uncharacterized protein n=1 Tax=Platanthera zijinensis TaxID=2320716 RepID=A0AAP0BWN6_9ASPA
MCGCGAAPRIDASVAGHADPLAEEAAEGWRASNLACSVSMEATRDSWASTRRKRVSLAFSNGASAVEHVFGAMIAEGRSGGSGGSSAGGATLVGAGAVVRRGLCWRRRCGTGCAACGWFGSGLCGGGLCGRGWCGTGWYSGGLRRAKGAGRISLVPDGDLVLLIERRAGRCRVLGKSRSGKIAVIARLGSDSGVQIKAKS